MSEEVKFYGQELWSYWDLLVTENRANLSTGCIRDDYGLKPVYLKFDIFNSNTKAKDKVNLTHRNVFLFLARFKPISDNLQSLADQMSKDNNVQKGFIIDGKKNIHVSMMMRSEFKLPCFRVAIASPKDKALMDALKCYVNYYDFLSMVKIMTNFRDNYMDAVNAVSISTSVSDLTDIVSNVSHKISMYYSELRGISRNSKDVILSDVYKRTMKETDEIEKDSEILEDIPSSSDEDELSEEPSEENDNSEENIEVEEKEEGDLQQEMENYVSDNKNDMVIDAPKELNSVVEDTEKKEYNVTLAEESELFTTKFISGDTSNLETMIIGMIHDINPFDKFVEMLSDSLGVTKKDLLPGCTEKDYNALCYVISRYIKYVLGKHLGKSKTPLPKSVNPIKYNSDKCTKLNRSIMYDIFVYFMYYTQLHNQLKEKITQDTTDSKGIVSFCMKVIMSPFIFSFLDNISSEENLVTEVCTRYKKYKDIGVFSETEKEINTNITTKVEVDPFAINTSIKKLYPVALKNIDKFHVENVWNFLKTKMKALKLEYEILTSEDLSIEQINNILMLEKGLTPSSSDFDEKEFKEIPDKILKIFGLNNIGPDNTNLKKYLKKEMEDSEHLEQALAIADKMPESYHQLKDKDVDLSPFSKNILVAFCCWDTNNIFDLKQSEDKIKELVEKSTLDRASALSMLYRTDNKDTQEEWGNLSLMVGSD